MKRLLDFIDGKEPEDDYTRELDEAVQAARRNEKWSFLYNSNIGNSKKEGCEKNTSE